MNDTLAGRRVAVFSKTTTGAAFLAEVGVGGEPLTFAYRGGRFTDTRTGSAWSLAGVALSGPLKGKTLKPLPGRRAFWFSVAGAVPGIGLYKP